MSNPTPTPTPQVPATIKIGDLEYSVSATPEIQELINAVRTETAKTEKAKLYSKIAALQEQAKALSSIELPAQPPQGPSAIDIDQIKGVFEQLLDERLTPILKSQKRNEEMSINEYRNKLITENQTTCIPELVVGNSREELDAALEKSKETLTRALAANGVVPGVQLPTTTPVIDKGKSPDYEANRPIENTPKTTPAPVTVVTPPAGNPPPSNLTRTDIKNMSASEFAANRDALFKEVQALVEGNGL